MQIDFVSAVPAASGPLARIVNLDALPADLDPVLAAGAKASRFTGKAGQLHDGFVSAGGAVQRVALAGAGDAAAKDRLANLERAGAAITAKYLASGETAVTIDFAGSGLDAAGAAAVLLASDARSALLVEHRDGAPAFADLLARLPPCDLVLVEGWKREPIPKLEVHRAAAGKPWLFPDDPHVLAVAADMDPPGTIPRIDLDAVSQLTDFILTHAHSFPASRRAA